MRTTILKLTEVAVNNTTGKLELTGKPVELNARPFTLEAIDSMNVFVRTERLRMFVETLATAPLTDDQRLVLIADEARRLTTLKFLDREAGPVVRSIPGFVHMVWCLVKDDAESKGYTKDHLEAMLAVAANIASANAVLRSIDALDTSGILNPIPPHRRGASKKSSPKTSKTSKKPTNPKRRRK